jgi:hypothetical protein
MPSFHFILHTHTHTHTQALTTFAYFYELIFTGDNTYSTSKIYTTAMLVFFLKFSNYLNGTVDQFVSVAETVARHA